MSDAQDPQKRRPLLEAPIILSPQEQEHVRSPFTVGGTHEEDADDLTVTVDGTPHLVNVTNQSWETGSITLLPGTYTASASVALDSVGFVVDADPLIWGDPVDIEDEPEIPITADVPPKPEKKKRVTFTLYLKDVGPPPKAELRDRKGKMTNDKPEIKPPAGPSKTYKIVFKGVDPENYVMIVTAFVNGTPRVLSRLVRAKKP